MNSGSALPPSSVFSKPIPRSPPLFSLASKPTGTLLSTRERSPGPGGAEAASGKPNANFNKFNGVPPNTRSEGPQDAPASEPFINTPPKLVVWHPQQEKLLKQWGEMAASNRWMHFNTHLMYVKMTMWFTLPVIILSSLTGTMNFAQSSFPIKYHSMLPLIIGGVNLITGMITTIGSFLRVSELAEGNRVAALSYGKIASNIRVELLLPLSQRTMNGCDFIAMCRSEMDRLTEQTPDIPRAIERKFHASFKAMLSKGDDSFYTPDILTLRPVEIYKDKPISPIQVGEVVAAAADIFKKKMAERKQATQIQEQQTVIEVLQHQHADHIQKEKEVGTHARSSGANWAFVGSTAGSASGSASGSTASGSTASRRLVNTDRDQKASLPAFSDTDQTSNGSSAPHTGMMRHAVPRLLVNTDFRVARQQELDELRQRGFVRKGAQHYTVESEIPPRAALPSVADPSSLATTDNNLVDTAKSTPNNLSVNVAAAAPPNDVPLVRLNDAPAGATAAIVLHIVPETTTYSQDQLESSDVSTTPGPRSESASPNPETQVNNLFSLV